MSRKLVLAAAVLVAGSLASSSAFALEIVNMDKYSRSVQFTMAGAKPSSKATVVKVAASGKSSFDCSKGCTARLGKSDLVLKGAESEIMIKSDKLSLPKS